MPADPPVGVESTSEVVGCGSAIAGASVTDGCAFVSVSIASGGLASDVAPSDIAGAVKRAGAREDATSDVGTAICSVSEVVGMGLGGGGGAEDTATATCEAAAACEDTARGTAAAGEDTSGAA